MINRTVCVCSGKQKHSLSALDVMEAANFESAVDLENLKLLEVTRRAVTESVGLVFAVCPQPWH